MKFEFGVTLKDKITGFTGTNTGHCHYITGCDQYLLQPKVDKAGKRIEPQWFDEDRLEVVKNKKKLSLKPQNPGACEPAPMK